jgi:hypothetical protein
LAVRVRGPDATVVGHQCCRAAAVGSSASSSSCSGHLAPLLYRAGSLFEEYSGGNDRVSDTVEEQCQQLEWPRMVSLKPSSQLHFHMPHRPHRCPLGSHITKRPYSFSISSHVIFWCTISSFAGLSMRHELCKRYDVIVCQGGRACI